MKNHGNIVSREIFNPPTERESDGAVSGKCFVYDARSWRAAQAQRSGKSAAKQKSLRKSKTRKATTVPNFAF